MTFWLVPVLPATSKVGISASTASLPSSHAHEQPGIVWRCFGDHAPAAGPQGEHQGVVFVAHLAEQLRLHQDPSVGDGSHRI